MKPSIIIAAVEHHTLRFSLAKISNTTDSNGVICNNGRPYPVIITESEPPLATELKSFQLPPLEINKPARNSTTSPPSLDLPKVNGRSASIDSGIRSFYGTETESFQSTSRSGSKRNSTTTNVFMEEDPACSEDAGEVIDDKTESDQNQFVQKGGFSRHPHATDSSRTSLSDQSSSAKREDMAENQTTLPSVEQEEEEKGDTDADADADDDDDGIVHIIPPKGLLKIIAYVLLFPLIVLLFFTLPNVKKQVSHL